MERAYLCAPASTESNRPLPHFVGRFVGESYRADTVRLDSRINQCRDSMRDDASLSAARAGNNKQRTFNMKDSLFL
jgi:hypothetical protein